MGLTEAWSRLLGDLVQTFRGGTASTSSSSRSSSTANDIAVQSHPACKCHVEEELESSSSSMVRALITVFGMETASGRIKKEKARKVVEKLGLICSEEEKSGRFDLPGDDDDDDDDDEVEVIVDKVLEGHGDNINIDWKTRHELLRQAFKIFDEDGNGFIEAVELKRVLECLGLMDKGNWDMDQIQKMLRVVDLNLDGKVDFYEFELMMGV